MATFEEARTAEKSAGIFAGAAGAISQTPHFEMIVTKKSGDSITRFINSTAPECRRGGWLYSLG
jgi:hypothetical protein